MSRDQRRVVLLEDHRIIVVLRSVEIDVARRSEERCCPEIYCMAGVKPIGLRVFSVVLR